MTFFALSGSFIVPFVHLLYEEEDVKVIVRIPVSTVSVREITFPFFWSLFYFLKIYFYFISFYVYGCVLPACVYMCITFVSGAHGRLKRLYGP